MTFGSLFAGIGGIDEGLERAGMTCRWQVEIDEFCRKVLGRHWPSVPKYGDIRTVTGREIEPVDLIAGGYPCQPFSQAGKRGGAADPRHLWPQFRRLLRILRPRYALLENVPGHLSLGFGDVLGDLARLGFDAEWTCLRASDFGAAHLRKRVFIVAYRADGRRRELREPSGRAGLLDGCDEALANAPWNARHRPHGQDGARRGICEAGEHMADAGCARIERPAQPPGQHGQWASGDDSRASGVLVHTNGSRSAREIPETCSGRHADHYAGPLMADASGGQLQEPQRGSERRNGFGSAREIFPDATSERWQDGDGREERANGESDSHRLRSSLPDATRAGLSKSGRESRGAHGSVGELRSFAPGPTDPRWPTILAERPDLAPAIEPAIRGVADGISANLDGALQDRTRRLKALGNSVVPQVAEWIGRRILEFDDRQHSLE